MKFFPPFCFCFSKYLKGTEMKLQMKRFLREMFVFKKSSFCIHLTFIYRSN